VNVNPLCGGGQFGPPKAALVQGDYKLLCYCFSVAGIDNATTTGCQVRPKAPGTCYTAAHGLGRMPRSVRVHRHPNA
jgi:hypothetical protein